MTDRIQVEATVVLNIDADASEDDIFKQIIKGAQIAETRGGSAIKNLQGALRRFSRERGAVQVAEGFRKLSADILNTEKSVGRVTSASAALRRSFGESFDPRNVDAFEDVLSRLVIVLGKLDAGNLSPQEFAEATQEVRGLQTALVAARDTVVATGRASDEVARNISRDQRQVSRETIEASRTARARFVVEQQRQASAARDSARQRVAIIQATARTIASIERGLSNIFRNTARVFSSAFRAAGQAVTGVATGIGRAFQSATSNIRSTVTNNSSEIRNSYSSAFNETTNIVREETNQQRSIINNFAQEATQSIGGIGLGTAGKFALGGVAAAAGVRALRGGFDRATTIETANKGLEVLLGSAEEAEALLTSVVDVVTGTPFALDQFAQGASRLVAFGLEAEKIPRFLAAAGDAAALSGKDAAQTIDTLIRVTGQATATGKLYGDQLIQLGEAGVPALRILGNAFGVATEDVQKLLTDGTIPANEALEALFTGITEGTEGVNEATPAFGGLARELGDTLAGAVSNFRISFDRAGANLFEVFTPAIVAAAKAATAAVDLIGSAFQSLGQSIVDSPTFALIQRALVGLGAGINDLRKRLKPVFDFLADGLVVIGQVALAFQAFRRIPGVVSLVGLALRRVLTPFNLLFGAVTLLAAGLQRIFEASPDLRTAVGLLGEQLGILLKVVGDLASDALRVLASAIATVVTPVAEGLAVVVGDLLLPAFVTLIEFIQNTVFPALRRFALFVEENIFPVVGDFLARAIEVGRRAFDRLVDVVRETVIPFLQRAFETLRTVFSRVVAFVRTSVIPVIGEALARAVEIGTAAFRSAYDFLSDTFVPFIQNNLAAALAGVGAAIGLFAISGNPLIAVFAGLTTAAVVALSDKDIRDALIENIRGAIDSAKDLWDNFVDSGVLVTIGVQVLKVVRRVGEIIGSIVTDPAFVAALAGIVAAAVALGGSFVLGLLEGIESNLGDLTRGLVDLLSEAIPAAIEAVVSDPRIVGLIGGLFIGAAAIRAIRSSGRRIGRTLAAGVEEGASSVSVGSATGGRGGGFVAGLFGGENAIRRQTQRISASISKDIANGVRRNQQVLQAAGINTDSSFVRNIQGLQESNRLIGELDNNIGQASRAGLTFREGLKNIASFRFTGLRDGIAQIRTALSIAGREAAVAAGIIAGAAFVGAFASSVAFEANATDAQQIQGIGSALVGGLTTGLFVGASAGGPAGAAAGVATAAVSLLGGAFIASKKNAEDFKKTVDALADSLENLEGKEFEDTISDTVTKRLREQSDDTREILLDIGVDLDEFAERAAAGEGIAFIAEQFEALGPAGKAFGAAVRDGSITLGKLDDELGNVAIDEKFDDIFTPFAGLTEEFKAAGLDIEDSGGAFSFLGETLKVLAGSLDELDLRNREEDTDRFLTGWERAEQLRFDNLRNLNEVARANAEAADIAAGATQAYRDKIEELNDARIDALKEKVNEAKGLVEEAGRAADVAREKLVAFLTGETVQTTLQGTVDEATIAVGGLGERLVGLAGEAAGAVNSAEVREVLGSIRDEVAGVLTAADIEGLSKEDAVALLDPLLQAAQESGAGEAVIGEIQGAIDRFNSEPGQTLFGELIDAEALVTEAQTALDEAEGKLQIGLELSQEDIDALFSEEATAAFEEYGKANSDGYLEGFDSEAVKDSASDALTDALAEAATALGISSPSTEFASLGRFSVQGYTLGVASALPAARSAMIGFGAALFQGFRLGLESQRFSVLATARSIASAAAAVVADELDIDSPSKVFEDLGRQTMEGFAAGINDGAQLAADAADTAVSRALNSSVASIGGVTVGVTGGSGAGGGSYAITSTDIAALATAIAAETKPNVNIDQTFTEPVDSRALAADVAWRLT